jgi:hypothetical protein
VTADGLVEFVEDRSVESTCFAVAEHGLERIEIGVGAQHEDAVELLLLLDLVGIDRKVLVADRLEVAPKAGIANGRLVALGELAFRRGDDRGAVGRIFLRLLALRQIM